MQSTISLATSFSKFIEDKLYAKPEWQEWVLTNCEQSINQAFIESVFYENLDSNFKHLPEEDFLAKLRIARQKMMIALGVRDLAMGAQVDEVMKSMTYMAEFALHMVAQYYSEQLNEVYGKPYYPNQEEMKLWVIGMGKLGGRELNVSSDIDLIFVYDSDGQTQGASRSISHHEWFTLLGKKIIKGLTDLTAEGFVFRVDMRLRPNGDSGPLVSSIKMLEEYFLIQGREWERYAWIKARLVYPLKEDDGSGLSPALLAVVKPFVYRKYLDYGIIDAIRNLHHQIRYEANVRASQFPDRSADIKLGAGGIREIEFLAQMYQLIRGGQESTLRVRSTVSTLETIQALSYMPPSQVRDLLNAYDFYRKLEHRLQWWRDAQIHYLPIDQESLDRVAKSMNFESAQSFMDQLEHYQTLVSQYFSDAFTIDQQANQDIVQTQDLLGIFNFYPEFKARYEHFLQSPKYQLCNDVSKKNLNIIFLRISEIQPNLSESVLIKFLDLIEVIMRRAAYLSLLREYPIVIESVVTLLKESQWGGNYLIRHPHLLDEFIQNYSSSEPEDDSQTYWSNWKIHLRDKLNNIALEQDSQDLAWNILRDTHHAEIFQTLLADLGISLKQRLSVEQVSDRLSAMADIVIQETLLSTWISLVLKNDRLTKDLFETGFGVIAYGKLGGKELGYGSDLDLVFVYDDLQPHFDEEFIESFLKLVRRFIMCCTTVTSSGVLFEIDTRLRPNGVAGLMATSLSAFEAYQMQQGTNVAWIWEHQALTRARFCAGSEKVRVRFEQIRAKVIGMAREPSSLRNSITEMRLKIHEGHPNRSNDFDLKHDEGGMVDIEFMIQWIVLRYAHLYPQLQQNIGNIALLKMAASLNIINQEDALAVSNAYRIFRKKQHQLRLDGLSVARVSREEFEEVFAAHQIKVLQVWQQLMLLDH
jgi:glutamate-ammonia-ligase adenylyltransferase